MSENKILTHKGYAIRKTFLKPKELELIQKHCVVEPNIDERYKVAKEYAFTIYRESPERYYLPREWALQKFGPPEVDILSEGLELSANAVKFLGTPYDYQIDIMNMYMKSPRNGLICVPCGKGKTFMALHIASQIKKRFLIVVDKEFLMNQWKKEMQSLMPNLRIGIVQADKREVESELYDCSICMIQTLCSQTFSESTFKTYGFTIFDECHHLGAQHFSKCLFKIQTKKMLGLSATPKREDGLTKVFEMFLGTPLYWEKVREPDPSVLVKGVKIECQDPEYLKVPLNWKKDVIIARLLTSVLECKERNTEILRWIHNLCKDSKRKILVLSARIAHLEGLESMCNKEITRSYYIGGMKEEVRETGAQNSQVLFASYSMASEAMNIKSLNTVLLVSPRSNVEQSTGRILRVLAKDRVVEPLIVDFIDPHGPFQSQWKGRYSYYKKCAYSISILRQGMDTGESNPVVNMDGCLFSDE